MKLSDVKDYAILAALAVGGVMLYRWANKVPEALAKVGEKVGETVWYLFGGAEKERDALGAMYYYIVHFAGDEKHAIPELTTKTPDGVDKNGRFTFRGKQFVIRDRKNPTTGKTEHWAFNP